MESEITHFAMQEPHALTLKQILNRKNDCDIAHFLLEELPIRYAVRIKLVETLPDWQRNPHLVDIHQIYSTSFKTLRTHTYDNRSTFRRAMINLKRRHCDVTNKIVSGIRKVKADNPSFSESGVNEFFNTFFVSRIGTEMLTSQYLAMTAITSDGAPGSIIDQHCDPLEVVKKAASDSQHLCEMHHNIYPAIEIQNQGAQRLPFVPTYLYYILFELLKNSSRAVIENGKVGDQNGRGPAPITVTLCGDENFIGVKVSDIGGGIPLEDTERIWSYLYTTAKELPNEESQISPLAGFGCGLPLSRVYAKYLGGSLDVVSIPRYGTDAYLYLNCIGNTREVVPRSFEMTLGSSVTDNDISNLLYRANL